MCANIANYVKWIISQPHEVGKFFCFSLYYFGIIIYNLSGTPNLLGQQMAGKA